VTVTQQCVLAGVSRATVYAQQKPRLVDDSDLLFSRLIDEEYTRRPFYGSRKMVVFLKERDHIVNRKRVQRLMRQMGLAGMAPGPNTSRPHPEHKVYPYLLLVFLLSGPTRSGARTLPTFGWLMASPTWWRSSTGTHAGC
jgi:putative transposase